MILYILLFLYHIQSNRNIGVSLIYYFFYEETKGKSEFFYDWNNNKKLQCISKLQTCTILKWQWFFFLVNTLSVQVHLMNFY